MSSQLKYACRCRGIDVHSHVVPADLPPDFQFALTLALIRGHLLVGDELVKAGQWDAAMPHFLHPTEELYGGIKDKVADYNTPALR